MAPAVFIPRGLGVTGCTYALPLSVLPRNDNAPAGS